MSAAFDGAGASRTLAPAIEVRRLTAFYQRVEVLHGIDFSLAPGQLMALLGANGAGKSSLLGAVAGVVNSKGSVKVDGSELSGVAPHIRARSGVALVPEVRGNLFPALSVQENLELAYRALEVGAARGLHEQVHEMFPILRERADAQCGMLSGGEQQMLAIALALGRRPRVLLLDEPTQGLAPSVLPILHRAFAALKAQGLAIVLAEQNLPFAARCADSFVVLAGGHVSLRGAGTDLKDQERLMAAYMGRETTGTVS
ncbi:ABC transporter ATP-binding protein [Variovorax sp. J22P168]|uniref:ABC transporter ATP-binding protein n=1 Tax=Variovorax jilinensis TaxID=3053513 RepID=UPI00257639C0|nr:ABC transporter ATP-binding protein [Variovorax sp. J22P168]MDM0014919.1 ABC transporter ATP-binding protein [Variovorax sp. J22P168]